MSLPRAASFLGTLLALGLGAAPVAAQDAPPLERDAAALAAAMSRPFVAPKPSDSGELLSDFRARITALGDGEWIYLQRNRGDKPYRQRVLQLIDQPDGSVKQIAWNLTDQEKFVDAQQQLTLLDQIDRAALVATFTEGCAQKWQFAATPKPRWTGIVDPQTCVIMSQRRGKNIRIGAEARLDSTGLYEAERGFSMAGEQLWGTPIGEYALIMRDPSATGSPASSKTAAGAPEYLANGGAFPLSEAVQVGDILYLSGQLGIDESGRALVSGGIGPETRRTMDRIGTTLAKYGLDHDALFKCTVMLADIADFAAFNTVYRSYFKPGRYPSRSAFQTAGLVLDARVEVECWAWHPQSIEEPTE